MTESFGTRLTAAVAARGGLCVGIDPHPRLLADWGLPFDAAGLERFALTCVEAFADEVSVVKPQSAFFEAHGARGIAVLERVISQSRQAGSLVLLDVKRGDVGSTMAAYAAAYLGDSSPLAADAITLSPYLGLAALEPALELAERTGRGVFLLALTSNPDGATVQRAVTGDGHSVAQRIAHAAGRRNAGVRPLGSVGLVVGATTHDATLDLSGVNGPILAPGLGAQGATVADLRHVFGAVLPSVLPVSAREILRHGPEPAALRSAALATRDAVAALLTDTSTDASTRA